MNFTQTEKQCVIDMLLENVYEFIDENDIDYREVNKPSQSWEALCVLQGKEKIICFNIHTKKEFEGLKRISKPFSIIHEIGHYFDPNLEASKEKGLIKNKDLEKTADNYIFTFCGERLTLIEFFSIDRFITSFSKIKRTYTKEEMKEIEEQYDKFKAGLKERMEE